MKNPRLCRGIFIFSNFQRINNGVLSTETAGASHSTGQAGTTATTLSTGEVNAKLEQKLTSFNFTTEQRAVAEKYAATGDANVIPGNYDKATVKNIIEAAGVITKFNAENSVDSRQGEGYNKGMANKTDDSVNDQISVKLAKEIYRRAETAESKVTETLKILEVDGARLEGLEFKLKSIESLTRKILTDTRIKNITIEEAAAGIRDSLRYTLVIDETSYTQTVITSLIKLKNQGYKISKINNFWGDDIYQGINVQLITPSGLIMELQFHTDASYYTKEVLNHKYYEIARDLSNSQKVVDNANRIMTQNQSKVKIPIGAKSIGKEKGN